MTTSTLNARIPEHAPYPGSADSAWNRIPLGVGANGEVAWEPSFTPHMLITGGAGSGKSIVQRSIFLHLLQHKDKWSCVGIDPKGVEFTPYKEYEVVQEVATNLSDSVPLLRNVEQELHERYALMEKEGVSHFTYLSSPPKALLVMIDLLTYILAPFPEDSVVTEQKKTVEGILSTIVKQGRAAGIHLVCDMQRADSAILPSDIKDNFGARIACGRMDKLGSMTTLGSDSAMHLPAVRGRGIFRTYQEEKEFQMYYAPPTWAEDNLQPAQSSEN